MNILVLILIMMHLGEWSRMTAAQARVWSIPRNKDWATVNGETDKYSNSCTGNGCALSFASRQP